MRNQKTIQIAVKYVEYNIIVSSKICRIIPIVNVLYAVTNVVTLVSSFPIMFPYMLAIPRAVTDKSALLLSYKVSNMMR